jgi:predicted secreted protein
MLFKALLLEKRVYTSRESGNIDPLLRIKNGIVVYDAVFFIITYPPPSIASRRFRRSTTRESYRLSQTSNLVKNFRSHVVIILYGLTPSNILSRHVFRTIYTPPTN